MTNKKSLAEIQLELQSFLLDQKEAAGDLTLETPNFSKQERLQIYHSAYRLRLLEALGNDYPALKLYLGEDSFNRLATEFIKAHPSQHPSLRWLGEKLPDFLRNHEEWKNQLEIAELATLEWRQAMAFDAADTPLATLDNLRTLAPEHWMTLRLQLHPSVQLMQFNSNCPLLWQSLTKSEADIPLELSTDAQTWLMWREDLQVVYRPLGAAEAWALTAFLAGDTFAAVCEGLCEWFSAEQVPMQAAQYLQHWINGGLIGRLITDED